jgi:hypothetical protein
VHYDTQAEYKRVFESVTPITPDLAAHPMPIQANPLPMLGSHGNRFPRDQRAAAGIAHNNMAVYMQGEVQHGPSHRRCPVRREMDIEMNLHRV